MLSLFDRMDGHPAVEDDQRHVNLVLCPSEASTAFRAVPGIDIREPSWWFEVAQWSGGGCGAADRDPFRTRRNRGGASSSKVAHMPTIEITGFSSLLLPAPLRHRLALSSEFRRTRPGCESVKVKGTSPSEPTDRTRRIATKSLIAETGAMSRNGHGAKLLSALAVEPRSHRHPTSAAVSGRTDSHALSNASKKSLDGNPGISTTRWVGRHLPSTNSTCQPFSMRRVIDVSRT